MFGFLLGETRGLLVPVGEAEYRRFGQQEKEKNKKIN